jgi:hypothetical protein
MKFIGYIKSSNEKIEDSDLIDFNYNIKNNEINKIEIEINDNVILIDLESGMIKKNDDILFAGFVGPHIYFPKLFRRKTFEIGNNHRKIIEKYIFGYITADEKEKYVICDENNFSVVDKR